MEMEDVCKACRFNCVGEEVKKSVMATQDGAGKIEVLRMTGKNVSILSYAENLIDLASKAHVLNGLVPSCPMAPAIVSARSQLKAGHRRLNEWGGGEFVVRLESVSVGLFGVPLAQL